MASAMDTARDKASELGDVLSLSQAATQQAKGHLDCKELPSMREASKIAHAEVARVVKAVQDMDAAIADAELEAAAEQAKAAAERAKETKAHLDKLFAAAKAKKVAAAKAGTAVVAAAAASGPGSWSSPLCVDAESGDEREVQEEVQNKLKTAYCEAREGEHGKRAFAREELRAAGEQAVPIDVGRFSHAKPVDGHDERRGTHEEREGGGEDSARGDCGETSGDGDDAPTRRPGPRLSRNRPLSVSTPSNASPSAKRRRTTAGASSELPVPVRTEGGVCRAGPEKTTSATPEDEMAVQANPNTCKAEECAYLASYGVEGSRKLLFCGVHKEAGHVLLKEWRVCSAEGCSKLPSYGQWGTTMALFCSPHAMVGMVNVISKKCLHEGCDTTTAKKAFCSEHSS